MPSTTDKTPPFTEEQFNQIHNTYNRRLLLWFRKRVPYTDVAEELTVNTLLKLWKSEYRGECAISTWIYRIADSVLADWQKSAKQRNTFLEEAMENRVALEQKCTPHDESGQITEAADPAPNPEKQAMIREQLAGRFNDPRLESLDAITKEILIRYFIEDDPVGEIAADLGMSPSSVYKRILRICPKT
jgi:RNA polymerase sigma-70 factor (ECF subfamily)